MKNYDTQTIDLDAVKANDKKLRKQYLQDIKRHRKELIKIAKNTGPWEYGASFEFIVEHLKMMVDYYTLGYNVWGIENEDPENDRNTIATKMIEEYEAYECLPDSERENIAAKFDAELDKMEHNVEFTKTDEIKIFGDKCTGYALVCKYYPDEVYLEYIKAVEAAEEQHFCNFIKLLQEKFRYLWD